MKTKKSPQEILDGVLRKQYLITGFIESKLAVADYIMDGYAANKPILINNGFLHFTAQLICRSIPIDLHALFGDFQEVRNKYAFDRIEKEFADLYEPKTIIQIKEWIDSVKDDIKIVTQLRHNQMAHYNFEVKNAIQLSVKELPTYQKLYKTAKLIVELLGVSTINESNKVSYRFDSHHSQVQSLEELVNYAVQGKEANPEPWELYFKKRGITQ